MQSFRQGERKNKAETGAVVAVVAVAQIKTVALRRNRQKKNENPTNKLTAKSPARLKNLRGLVFVEKVYFLTILRYFPCNNF